jgi:hypothetical protein
MHVHTQNGTLPRDGSRDRGSARPPAVVFLARDHPSIDFATPPASPPAPLRLRRLRSSGSAHHPLAARGRGGCRLADPTAAPWIPPTSSTATTPPTHRPHRHRYRRSPLGLAPAATSDSDTVRSRTQHGGEEECVQASGPKVTRGRGVEFSQHKAICLLGR